MHKVIDRARTNSSPCFMFTSTGLCNMFTFVISRPSNTFPPLDRTHSTTSSVLFQPCSTPRLAATPYIHPTYPSNPSTPTVLDILRHHQRYSTRPLFIQSHPSSVAHLQSLIEPSAQSQDTSARINIITCQPTLHTFHFEHSTLKRINKCKRDSDTSTWRVHNGLNTTFQCNVYVLENINFQPVL